MNLFSECGQKYKNIAIIEFSSINCCATSEYSFGNREKKSTVINIVAFLIPVAQCTAVLGAGRPAREEKRERSRAYKSLVHCQSCG